MEIAAKELASENDQSPSDEESTDGGASDEEEDENLWVDEHGGSEAVAGSKKTRKCLSVVDKVSKPFCC
jgi:hypothetical protein